MPPGRPFISDSDSESYKEAECTDNFLQEISKKHPSYIKDTYDILSKLRTAKVQPHILLITLDASSTQREQPFCITCEYFEPLSEIVSMTTKHTF